MPKEICVQLDDPDEADECQACGKLIPGWTTKCPFCGAIQSDDFDKDLETLEPKAKTSLKSWRAQRALDYPDEDRPRVMFSDRYFPPVLLLKGFFAFGLAVIAVLAWVLADNPLLSLVFVVLYALVFINAANNDASPPIA